MDDSTVTVDGTKYRIALELAIMVAKSEQPQQLDPRAYWLQLYRQCIDTVSAHKSIDSILTGKTPDYSKIVLRG
ncbi:MAG: hypothetical protein PSX80_00915 [bacterium]|nr:hypothetical protein [bacterium]